MVSDSITNASITCAPNVKDLGKKKRGNRSAKLKQSKLDLRREQWLAQVKSKGGREDWTEDEQQHNGIDSCTVALGRARAGTEQNGRGSVQESDSESHSNSTISFNSFMGSIDSGTNYSGSCSNSSSAGCCSGNITEEEEEDEDEDGCLDDWEAIADALAANDERSHPPVHPHHDQPEPVRRIGPSSGAVRENQRMAPKVAPSKVNHSAWRPDDAFRPHCLPNLSKNHTFPKSGRNGGGISWSTNSNSNPSQPMSCPICCEDLDMTDSSFLPCLCGFRLCLFCHKRILEQDGRCPGCRKPYEQYPVDGEATVEGGSLTFRWNRSYSMMTRP